MATLWPPLPCHHISARLSASFRMELQQGKGRGYPGRYSLKDPNRVSRLIPAILDTTSPAIVGSDDNLVVGRRITHGRDAT